MRLNRGQLQLDSVSHKPLDSRKHLPALDGLRGVAILAVLAMHFAIADPLTDLDRFVYATARNGWVGVDLFFVLSGFLITGILLDARGKSGAIRTFYARRFLRIFPLYYAVLIAVFVVAPFLVKDAKWLVTLQAQQWWHWSYLTNVLAAKVGWVAIPHLGHLWSLAIEEQFYLVWPFVVLFVARRRLVAVCGGMLVISLAARTAMVLKGTYPVAMYALTFTRWDGLAIGALIAIVGREAGGMELLRKWSRPVLWICAPISVAILAAEPYRSHYGVATQTVGYLLVALSFGAMLVQVLQAAAGSRVSRLLADSRLRFFGRYSYGMYVLHGPLLGVLAALGLSPALLPSVAGSALPGQLLFAAMALSLTTATALISWSLIERPFLALKRHFPTSAASGHEAPPRERVSRSEARAA